MNNFAELLILALIAGFIIFRLFMSLGKIDETILKATEAIKTVEPVEVKPSAEDEEQLIALDGLDALNLKMIEDIKQIEPEFSIGKFIKKSTQVFEYILDLFSKQDLDGLRELVSPEVFAAFQKSIEKFEHDKIKLKLVVVSISQTKILSVMVEENKAKIKLEFESHQIEYKIDNKNAIVSGNSSNIIKKHDIWVFSRELGSPDPKWLLISTESK